MLGTLFIVAVFALTLPLTIPRLMGYQVFSVISGSMEPAIPVGSVIYVREADASEVQVDEIIAFYDEGSVVAHRVVANRTSPTMRSLAWLPCTCPMWVAQWRSTRAMWARSTSC